MDVSARAGGAFRENSVKGAGSDGDPGATGVCDVPSGPGAGPRADARRAHGRAGKQSRCVSTDPGRHSRGEPGAPVVIVEYGDFECPYCARAAAILHELVDSSDGQVRQVFRHFPVFDIHPYALTAALAAEVAGAHGRFWEMHDLLFANQDKLADKYLMAFARSLEIETDLVVGDPAQPYGDAVEADYAGGAELRVQGTPTIFIDGVRYRGRLELGPLRTAVARTGSGRSADDRDDGRRRRVPWARR